MAVLLGAVLLAGCGGESPQDPPPAASRAGPGGLATTARVADCADWNRASVEERVETIDGIREYQGGPTTGGTGVVLPDEDAYELFEGYCDNEFARAFKLYKLYARAAGFQSYAP
jgi:hypothetical protein